MRRFAWICSTLFVLNILAGILVLGYARNKTLEGYTLTSEAQQLQTLSQRALVDLHVIDWVTVATLLDANKMDEGPRKIEAFDDLQRIFADMRGRTHSPELARLIDALVDTQQKELAPVDTEILEQADANKAREIYFSRYVPLMRRFQAVAEKVYTSASADAEVAQARALSNWRATFYLCVVTTSVLGAIMLLTVLYTARRLTESLHEAVQTMQHSGIAVSSAATDLLGSVHEQEVRVTEQSTSTVQVGATSHEIAANTTELTQAMGEVAEIAENTAQLANSGRQALERMEDTTSQIFDLSKAIVTQFSVLNQRASNISTVITTISKVADQTNLLSLNAAIEAEKAGDAGRGFGVVAVEIRRLADQTAVATLDVERLIKDVQSAVSTGVMGMDKFTENVRQGGEEIRQSVVQMNKILAQVQQLTDRFDLVNQGMRSQREAAQQISDAIRELGEVTRHSLDSINQTNSVVQQLRGASNLLEAAVNRFKTAADL